MRCWYKLKCQRSAHTQFIQTQSGLKLDTWDLVVAALSPHNTSPRAVVAAICLTCGLEPALRPGLHTVTADIQPSIANALLMASVCLARCEVAIALNLWC
eukprot:5325510-Amphidinium_carterae.1